MSEYLRLRIEGATYFFTVVTFQRRPFLTTDLARESLRNAWQAVRAKRPFDIDAVCILPDHLHCLWTLPPDDADYSIRWNLIKAAFTKEYLKKGGSDGTRNASRRRSGEAAVWQRRFWEHRIRNDEDLRRHFDYIHFTPVKHGYVNRPADWPWSSFHRYVQQGWYEPDWGEIEPKTITGFECDE